MSPATIRRIVLEIRHQREVLADEARWAETHKGQHAEIVKETFDRIRFWRAVMTDAERRLSTGE